jgi:hypothetical protein
MKLFANGCSFTWGGAIFDSLYDDEGRLLDHENTTPMNQHRLSVVWPARLGLLLSADETVNLAMGCGSNDRILRTTMDFFSALINRQEDLSYWYAVIQLTQAHRYEYWDEETQTWAMVIPQAVTFGRRLSSYDYHSEQEKKRDITYSYQNDISFSQKYFAQVVGLSAFFDKHQIKYRFVNLSIDPFELLTPWQAEYLTNNVNWIGDDPHMHIEKIFDSTENGSHPSLLGHQQIAESLYRYIKHDLSN